MMRSIFSGSIPQLRKPVAIQALRCGLRLKNNVPRQSSSTTSTSPTSRTIFPKQIVPDVNSHRSSMDAEKLAPDPKQTWPLDRRVAPHIRACLPRIAFESDDLAQRDTGLSVCTLGTGTGSASIFRNQAATVVRQMGSAYLVDAGEGVQTQFTTSRINVRDVQKIFITHMHADHIFGLPGLLLHLQAANLFAHEKRNIEIYGPVGIYNYIVTSLTLSGSEIRKLKVDVYELHGGTQRSMRPPNRKHFHDFRQKGVFRRVITQNEDGTFTLVEPLEITTRDLAHRKHSQPEGISIKAAEIHHVPQLQCFGYTFTEPQTQSRKLHVDRAMQLGVRTMEKYRHLKSGFSVAPDDDDKITRQIHPADVCDEPPKPRKITILGDTCLVPPAMERLATDSDVLIHEATLSMSDTGRKVTEGGHSTAAEAAIVANKVRAKLLLLSHLSVKVDNGKGAMEWILEAEDRVRPETRVQMAFDHMEVLIPKGGFDFEDEGESANHRVKAPKDISETLAKLMITD